ncbi:hypothetical protein BDY21DRAFT_10462 [Lineolata rhizophorae]|uniref:Uncharacterized protein n=1 Tax=Lineolata rhizophorae TaxID=578093 RepID=A0A6A6PE49_9PEZI|nr:hypothetical protein BDY21DRAFT_10462 [Lineolata rhizophorae]
MLHPSPPPATPPIGLTATASHPLSAYDLPPEKLGSLHLPNRLGSRPSATSPGACEHEVAAFFRPLAGHSIFRWLTSSNSSRHPCVPPMIRSTVRRRRRRGRRGQDMGNQRSKKIQTKDFSFEEIGEILLCLCTPYT